MTIDFDKAIELLFSNVARGSRVYNDDLEAIFVDDSTRVIADTKNKHNCIFISKYTGKDVLESSPWCWPLLAKLLTNDDIHERACVVMAAQSDATENPFLNSDNLEFNVNPHLYSASETEIIIRAYEKIRSTYILHNATFVDKQLVEFIVQSVNDKAGSKFVQVAVDSKTGALYIDFGKDDIELRVIYIPYSNTIVYSSIKAIESMYAYLGEVLKCSANYVKSVAALYNILISIDGLPDKYDWIGNIAIDSRLRLTYFDSAYFIVDFIRSTVGSGVTRDILDMFTDSSSSANYNKSYMDLRDTIVDYGECKIQQGTYAVYSIGTSSYTLITNPLANGEVIVDYDNRKLVYRSLHPNFVGTVGVSLSELIVEKNTAALSGIENDVKELHYSPESSHAILKTLKALQRVNPDVSIKAVLNVMAHSE